MSNWYSAPDCNKQGRPYTYSDVAIQTLLSIREVFHLTYRSHEGLGQSFFPALGIRERRRATRGLASGEGPLARTSP
ncbi:MAG: transposase [Thermoguttaceae bacterium]|nr:transposase [Thermoguttaceae bacterium]